MSLKSLIKRALGHGPVVHPVDRGLAKRYIKQRLIAVFPELRDNPRALEAAYRALDLDPQSDDHGETVYELNVHREPDC
jgi:hypothetical protein